MDFILVGWIANYVMLPFTWFVYWYLIIRRVSPKLKKKFWKRSALLSSVGLVPVAGEFFPEWIFTAIVAYLMVNYSQKMSQLTDGGEKKEGGGKEGGQAKAAATPS